MRAPTHISFATLIYLAILTSAGVGLNVWNGLVISLASVFPDVDTGASAIGRLFPWISRRLERRFGHRTLTHSIPFIVALAVLFLPVALVERDLYLCLLAGYASHPILDSCTVTGVRLLYPVSSVRCVFPMDVNDPMRYRINTGSRQETVLAVVFLLACILAFLVARQGLERFVRVTQGNIEAAVRDYNDFSATNLVWVECSATNLLSKERLVGRYRAIGALDAQTLLVQTGDGKLRTLGKEYRSDYTAERVVCMKGEPAATTIERIDMSGGREIGGAGEVHLFGTLVLSEEVPRPESRGGFSPLTATGRELRLNYATPAVLAAYLRNVAVESGYLDVRRVIRAEETAPPLYGPPAEFWETLKLQPEAEIIFICASGDTVPAWGLLAAWDEQGGLRRDAAEVTRSIAALRLTGRERQNQLCEKMVRLEGTVQTDSISLRTADALYATGFLPESAVHDAAVRLGLSRLSLATVASERIAFRAGSAARMLVLRNRQESLKSRLLPGVGKKSLLSRTGGVVVSVERKETRIRILVRSL